MSTESAGDPPASEASDESALLTSWSLYIHKHGSGGGHVSTVPVGTSCSSLWCSAMFAHGTSVTLTATPAPYHIFGGWTGLCSGTGTCTVTMNQDLEVGANFQWPIRVLRVQKTGPAASFVASGSYSPQFYCYDPSCSAGFLGGTTLVLYGVPVLDSGVVFAGWKGGGCSGTGPCTITLDSDVNLTAAFVSSLAP